MVTTKIIAHTNRWAVINSTIRLRHHPLAENSSEIHSATVAVVSAPRQYQRGRNAAAEEFAAMTGLNVVLVDL